MPWNIIKLNKAQCKYCDDIVLSTDDNLKNKCTCGKLIIDGGSSFLSRSGDRGVDYKELSELNFGEKVPNIKGEPSKHEEILKWQNESKKKKGK